MKCIKPIIHRPEFQSKHHCKLCEAERIIKEITGEEE